MDLEIETYQNNITILKKEEIYAGFKFYIGLLKKCKFGVCDFLQHLGKVSLSGLYSNINW